MRTHSYELAVTWTGDRGTGTRSYRGYGRDHTVEAIGKPALLGSSDPSFRGSAERWNPEELLVAALAQCHMLWYLHLATTAGVVVTGYRDAPLGTMLEDERGAGRFTDVLLRPEVTVEDAGMVGDALRVHGEVPAMCFIARSVNFPVRHDPTVRVAPAPTR